MNSLKRLVVGTGLACCLLAVCVAGCNITIGPALRGSGVTKTETRDVAPFSEIEVGSAIQLDVVVGEPTTLVVTADDNVLPLVRTEVAGQRLKVYLDSSLSTDIGVQVKVGTPELRALVGSGTSKVDATGITGEEFQLELHGASNGNLSSKTNMLDITLSGASRAVLSGACHHLNVKCFGASQLNAADLTAAKVTANVSGASSAQVNAQEELTADASGASHIRYSGQPAKLSQQASGASTVAAK